MSQTYREYKIGQAMAEAEKVNAEAKRLGLSKLELLDRLGAMLRFDKHDRLYVGEREPLWRHNFLSSLANVDWQWLEHFDQMRFVELPQPEDDVAAVRAMFNAATEGLR
jgi:hypothetical protein